MIPTRAGIAIRSRMLDINELDVLRATFYTSSPVVFHYVLQRPLKLACDFVPILYKYEGVSSPTGQLAALR